METIVDLSKVNNSHIDFVGGKNASIGEMIQNLSQKNLCVPGGFATTADAYREFLKENNLEEKIPHLLTKTNIHSIKALNKSSQIIQRWILKGKFSSHFEKEISQALKKLKHKTVAVRSSATAEDLPEASFAGQQDTYLNVKGTKNILQAIKMVYASLFTSRAMAYRAHHKFTHVKFAISAGIQPMIRSDKGASGVMFTIDTESGFDQIILVNASYGLGEALVQGKVSPDEFYLSKVALEKNAFSILQRKLGDKKEKMIYTQSTEPGKSVKIIPVPKKERAKFCINDNDIAALAKAAMLIEKHYQKPMDIEWAKDGIDGKIYILQARPETVKSRENPNVIEQYQLTKPGKILSTGLSIGQRIASGKSRIISDPKKMHLVQAGDVIVTDMTDPDWEPVMKKAAAIVTNRGGRTCHAAIIARELGIPAIVGCNDATKKIKNQQSITVSCAEGQSGYIYEGKIPFDIKKTNLESLPNIPLKLCMNVGNPDIAFATQAIPNHGVGLARLEFIISGIGVHPNAVLNFKKLPKSLQKTITQKSQGYANPIEYYIEKLREGIATISAAFYPKEVIFRFSDFKANEYANLLGGELYETLEENPMLGFRGAFRYTHERFRRSFELECEAFKRVRNKMGLTNAQLMIPFVRTVEELKGVIALMETYGLKRNADLKIYMMCEIPSNVILAEEFLHYVDGFSIGSNDLTQLVLGLDRDSNVVASLFNERDNAVKAFLDKAIETCNRLNKYIGICGQGPSDHPDFAEWLMQKGIQSISLNPDSILQTWMRLADKIKTVL